MNINKIILAIINISEYEQISSRKGENRMSSFAIFIIVIALGLIIGGIMVLKKSAKKFNLNEEQLQRIKQRSKEQQEKDQMAN